MTYCGEAPWRASYLAPENHPADIEPWLPAVTVELGIEMLFHRPADAEISHQRPGRRHIEGAVNDLRLENGDPAQPQTFGACRKPQGLNGGHHRITQRLGHGAAAESTALFRRLIGEYRDMHRRIFEAFKFQSRIMRALLAVII